MTRLVVWIASEGSLAATLASDSLLLDWWRHGSPATQIVCIDEAWTHRHTVLQLRALGIDVVTPIADGVVFAEVTRPDGRIVAGIVARRATGVDDPRRESLVTRAPRLRRLELECIERPCPAARRALFEELLTRRDHLAFFATPDGRLAGRDFGDGCPTLVLYADRQAILRAARELGLAPNTFAIGSLGAREILAFAAGKGIHLALAVFPDHDTVKHLVITALELRELAAGRLPAVGDGG